MIVEVTMYGATCDNCGKRWIDEHNGFAAFTDKWGMGAALGDDTEWYTHEDSHYCGSCYSFDDEDNLILTEASSSK